MHRWCMSGDAIEVRVPACPEPGVRRPPAYVAPSIDPDTHRLPVHAALDNPDWALKPEMLATFRIITGAVGTSPAVPESALGWTKASWFMSGSRMRQEGRFPLREIKIGRISDGMGAGHSTA